jgi:predicted DNA-binding protein with PD1-like motif
MRSRLLETDCGRRKYVLVLDAEEEAVATIAAFATQEAFRAPVCPPSGLLADLARLLQPSTKEFVQNEVDEQTEVLSMLGNIASGAEGQVKLHIHVVLGCRDASTRGGHLVAGWARPTLEVMIEESPEHLQRGLDQKTGLVLLQP